MVNLGSVLSSIFGTDNKKKLKEFSQIVKKINELEEHYKSKDHEEILKEVESLKNKSLEIENLDSLIPEAFAIVREVSKRQLGLRHYDCQLLGGIALHNCQIAEMATGEGKTLVATLPSYLNSITKRKVVLVST